MKGVSIRVAYIIDSLFGGGAETSLLALVPGLEREGVALSLYTLFADDGALDARISALGLKPVRLQSLSWPARLSYLRRDIRRAHPDVIHTCLPWSDVAGRIVSTGTAVPVVTSLVNCSYGPEHRASSVHGPYAVRAMQLLDALTARRNTVFHAISNEVASTMSQRLHVPLDRMRIVPESRAADQLGRLTSDRRARARAGLGVPENAPMILMVGRLDPQKGIEIGLRSVEMLQADFPDLQVVVAGRDGGASDQVRRLAGRMRNVKLLGHRQDVPDIMCAADCLCFPSRWEGLGGALIEALALELPVVATSIPPIRETLGDVAWPLVPVDDPEATAVALRGVLSRPPAVKSLAAAGRLRYERRFTPEASAKGIADIYRELAQ